jgi:uncharacterized protein (TIGR03382 family)
MRALVLLIAVSACTTELASLDQAIIGGTTTTTAKYPTVVALEEPQEWGCTGTLVHEDWVLSAAHCVEGLTTSTLKIRFDDNNLNDTGGGKVVAVAAIHAKPDWVDPVWDNDVALIELATSITDREPTPIERSVVAAATTVTAVGYGDSDTNGNGGGILRELKSTTIDCDDTNDPELSGTNLLCFDPTSGKASCDGDSGGPAFVTVGGKLRVAGINSGNTGDTCTEGWELYTSVAGELAFIDMYLPQGSSDPDGGGPGSDDPDPDGPDLDDPGDSGCSAASDTASLAIALLLLVMLVLRRRARARARGCR